MLRLNKKDDFRRVFLIFVAELLLFGVFFSYFAFAETPEEEKAMLEVNG